MSRWGVGPVFTALSVSYGLITLVLSHYLHPTFQIQAIPYLFVAILGIIFVVIGIPFFITSVVTVMRAYHADKLITGGIFGCCRHPLYASFVVFIVPGIVLLVNSWIALTVPIFMYIVARILVRQEEVYLENVFGAEYADYKKKVPCILPYGCFK